MACCGLRGTRHSRDVVVVAVAAAEVGDEKVRGVKMMRTLNKRFAILELMYDDRCEERIHEFEDVGTIAQVLSCGVCVCEDEGTSVSEFCGSDEHRQLRRSVSRLWCKLYAWASSTPATDSKVGSNKRSSIQCVS